MFITLVQRPPPLFYVRRCFSSGGVIFPIHLLICCRIEGYWFPPLWRDDRNSVKSPCNFFLVKNHIIYIYINTFPYLLQSVLHCLLFIGGSPGSVCGLIQLPTIINQIKEVFLPIWRLRAWIHFFHVNDVMQLYIHASNPTTVCQTTVEKRAWMSKYIPTK